MTNKREGGSGIAGDTAALWFDVLSSHSPDNLFIIRVANNRFYLHWANHTLERAIGTTLVEISGKSIRQILGPSASKTPEQNYRRCLESRQPVEYEETALDGYQRSRFWHTLLVPKIAENVDIPFIYGVSRDITEIVQAKREVEHANQIKAAFLGHMSHEVKTPLHSITGALSLLRKSGPSDDQQRYIDIIDASQQVILRMASDILDYAKLEAGKLQFEHNPFNLRELLEQVFTMMAILAAEKKLRFRLQVDFTGDSILLGDRDRIKQVLCNLLSNAIKFTRSGEITLLVKSTDDSDSQVTFVVQDEGIGIEAEDLGKLFQPFSRLANATRHQIGGTGLGLVISKELVERMGGTISVSSVPHRGTTFTVELPLLNARQPALDIKPDSFYVGRFSGGRILVAEDNRMCQIIANELLTQVGYDVVVVADGQQALNEIRTSRFDMVLMDWIMPGVNGKEATRLIRDYEQRTGETIPIIGMTANSTIKELQELYDVGMNDVITKPIAEAEMLAVIQRWLGKRRERFDSVLD